MGCGTAGSPSAAPAGDRSAGPYREESGDRGSSMDFLGGVSNHYLAFPRRAAGDGMTMVVVTPTE